MSMNDGMGTGRGRSMGVGPGTTVVSGMDHGIQYGEDIVICDTKTGGGGAFEGHVCLLVVSSKTTMN